MKSEQQEKSVKRSRSEPVVMVCKDGERGVLSRGHRSGAGEYFGGVDT